MRRGEGVRCSGVNELWVWVGGYAGDGEAGEYLTEEPEGRLSSGSACVGRRDS